MVGVHVRVQHVLEREAQVLQQLRVSADRNIQRAFTIRIRITHTARRNRTEIEAGQGRFLGSSVKSCAGSPGRGLQHGVDQHRLARDLVGQQVRVRTGFLLEQLAENQRVAACQKDWVI